MPAIPDLGGIGGLGSTGGGIAGGAAAGNTAAAAAAVGPANATRLFAIGDPGRDTLARLDRVALGERLPALLQSRFSDGSFQVELAGTSLRMSLPPGLQAGQRIELSLLAREPRLTFLLQGTSVGVRAQVSPAGRLIDTLLRPAPAEQEPGPRQPQAMVDAARPVVAAPLAQSEPLARALAAALSGSGLFYESHVARWAQGERSLEQLRQEPQFGWTEKNLQTPTGVKAWAPGAARQAEAPLAEGAAVEAVAQAAAEEPPLNIDPASEAAHMLRLQLDSLEHGQVLWRGQAWPGLPMQWGVAEDGGRAEAAQRSWQSVLRFQFDKLGTVAATLTLSGGQVQLALQAESEQVAGRLRGAAAELADAMKSAGTPLHLMTVRQEKSA